jgi:hypothetical protein
MCEFMNTMINRCTSQDKVFPDYLEVNYDFIYHFLQKCEVVPVLN